MQAQCLGMHQNPIEGHGHILTFDLLFGVQSLLNKGWQPSAFHVSQASWGTSEPYLRPRSYVNI